MEKKQFNALVSMEFPKNFQLQLAIIDGFDHMRSNSLHLKSNVEESLEIATLEIYIYYDKINYSKKINLHCV